MTVGGTFKAPNVTFKTTPVTVRATTTRVITPGSGAKLTTANKIMISYAVYNGKNGKRISTNFGAETAPMDLSSTKIMIGLSKGLSGQQVGSRLLVAIPPAEAYGAKGFPKAGVGPTDTIVFLIDVVSASSPLAKVRWYCGPAPPWGQTVGSRVLLVVPPADGYGAKGSPPIGANERLVFVVEILAAT